MVLGEGKGKNDLPIRKKFRELGKKGFRSPIIVSPKNIYNLDKISKEEKK